MKMMDDDIELDDLPPFEPDPRIQELVEYATSGIELVLNAEFLLDEWVTACLLSNPYTTFRYKRNHLTPEQKFVLATEESGMREDDEFCGRQVFGFLIDLYRLRAAARRLSDEELTSSILESAIRHGGEEEREDQEDCYIPIMAARTIVANHLAFAEGWLSSVEEEGLQLASQDPASDYPDWDVWEEVYSPVTYVG